ncbi:MAG: hypothetical protein K8S25_08670 [Alphaproteobacteria bacterium]|nr:hypothetical protein [Alphaproteobacteria bacterium]
MRAVWLLDLAARELRRRRAFAMLVLAAFVLQGVITQSHSHSGAPAKSVSVVAALGGVADAPAKPSPGDSGDANCPICHAASIAGAAVASAGPELRVPSLSSLVPYLDEHSVLVERFTAAWRSRAPPSL